MNEVLAKKILVLLEQEMGDIFKRERSEGELIPTGELNELTDLYSRVATTAPTDNSRGLSSVAPFFAGAGRPIQARAVGDGLNDRLMDSFGAILEKQFEVSGGSVKRAADLMTLADTFGRNNMADAQKKCADAASKLIMEESDEGLCAKLLGGRKSGENGGDGNNS